MSAADVVVAADQLDEAAYGRIAEFCEGWAPCRRVEQGKDEILSRAGIIVGWASPAVLLSGAVHTYLCGSAGYDAYVGVGLDRKAGFRMTSAGDIMAVTIAEHCLAMMFALARRIPEMVRAQGRAEYARIWDGPEITGTTACIVGLGNTGRQLALRCRALGQRVLGVCRTPEAHREDADEVFSMAQCREALARADHVFVLTAGGAGTRGLFDRPMFGAMKPGACFYSASRGSVTREDALLEALRSGALAGAGLDVFAVEPLRGDSPLWSFPNVLVSPHSAGLSCGLNTRLTDLFVENLRNVRDGLPLKNLRPAAEIA